MFEKILVALDGSEMSRPVFEKAVFLAKAANAHLILVHAIYPFGEAYPNMGYPGPNSVYPRLHTEALRRYAQKWETLEQQGVAFLRSLALEATQQGVVTEFTQPLGDPGQMVCTLARTCKADLIVIGRRGRKGLSEFLLGSVSNYVLHHAPCCVFTVQGAIHPEIDATPAQAASIS